MQPEVQAVVEIEHLKEEFFLVNMLAYRRLDEPARLYVVVKRTARIGVNSAGKNEIRRGLVEYLRCSRGVVSESARTGASEYDIGSTRSFSICSIGSTPKGVSLYMVQNEHLLCEQPVVTCRSSELASNGGLKVVPVYFILVVFHFRYSHEYSLTVPGTIFI